MLNYKKQSEVFFIAETYLVLIVGPVLFFKFYQ